MQTLAGAVGTSEGSKKHTTKKKKGKKQDQDGNDDSTKVQLSHFAASLVLSLLYFETWY